MGIAGNTARVPVGVGPGGIYRPFAFTEEVMLEADFFDGQGSTGTGLRHTHRVLFRSNGTWLNGYGLVLGRSDSTNSTSDITLVENGAALAQVVCPFSFGSQVHLRANFRTDGSVNGRVSSDGQVFDFSFGPRTIQSTGTHFAYASPENSSIPGFQPGIDSLVIQPIPQDNTPGLVARYTFDQTYSNSVPGGPAAAPNGTPQFVSGVVGNGLKLNGTTDWLDIGPDGYYSTVTAAAWVRVDDYPPTSGSNENRSYDIINAWKDRENFALRARRETNGDFPFVASFHRSSGNTLWPEQHLLSQSRIMPGTNPGMFQHVALTYDGTTLRFYVNGRLERSEATGSNSYNSPLPAAADLRIGLDHNGQSKFKGIIDEVRIYNRALSDAEILSVYNSEAGPVLYQNDFENLASPLSEWSLSTRSQTPGGTRQQTRYLGAFGNQTARLTVPGLADYATATVELDLYLMGTWDGHTGGSAEFWETMTDGGPNQTFKTSFSNADGSNLQAYPMMITTGYTPAFDGRSGALEVNSLGYGAPGGETVYRLRYTVAHRTGPLLLDFYGIGLESLANESWGIDNIVVRGIVQATASIAGTVSGTGLPLGLIQVVVNGVPNSFATTIPSPGGYSFSNVPAGQVYEVRAFVDANASGQQEPWEFSGTYLGNPLNLISNVNNIDITLGPPADADNDGLADAWETLNGLTVGINDAGLDLDNDGLINAVEYWQLSKPNQGDSDSDGVGDAVEYLAGTSLMLGDTDNDGLPDAWETANGLNALVNDAAGDADGDGLTNAQEYNGGVSSTNPRNRDSDGNGASDYEQRNGEKFTAHRYDRLDRLVSTTFDNGAWEGWRYDGNGCILRHLLKTARDADNDGLADAWEFANGLSFTSSTGSQGFGGDADGDGWTNQQEFLADTAANDATSLPPAGTGPVLWASPPKSRIIFPPLNGGAWSQVKARLWDAEANNAQATLQWYDTALQQWRAATILKVNNGPASGVSSLATSPGGNTHDLLWNAIADLPAAFNGTILLRTTAQDAAGTTTSETVPYTANTTGDFDGDGIPDAWEIANNLDPNDATGPNGATADTDHDSLNHFGEYVFHLSTIASDAQTAATTSTAINPADGKLYLTLTYRRRLDAAANGLTYSVQTTTDFTSWTTNGPDIEPVSTTPTGDGITELIIVRIKPPLDDAGAKKFVRVQVVK